MSIKKKITLSIIVLVVLGAITFVMVLVDKYNASENGITKKNYKEVQDVLAINEGTNLIKLVKDDMNNDNTLDYVGIIGTPKYKENKENTEKTEETSADTKKEITDILTAAEDLTKTPETYEKLDVVFIDGNTKELKKYESGLSFANDVKFEIKSDTNAKYIFVNDNLTGNVLLLNIVNNEFKNIIKDSISSDFNGYTISVEFDNQNTSKVSVKLDNYARSYLNAVNEAYTLEFTDTRVNKDSYRPTYLANKFCSFKLEDIDDDGALDFIGIQNLLYLNISTKDNLPQVAGTVDTYFKIVDGKIQYNKVEVKI